MKRLYTWLFFCLFGSFVTAVQAADAPLENQLGNHPSPYLALHGDDPVHWQLWNKATLEKAKALNRPVFISSGYFSCHWCHVMQRESYKDPELARLLNENFIPVKIDRELNPALDAHLIEFVELTRGQAGWPLNVFLTPDGYPILGLVYMPRDPFLSLLDQLHQRWLQDEQALKQIARDAMDEWRQLRAAQLESRTTGGSLVDKMLTETDRVKDDMSGGFGQQNKFPMASQLQALLYLRGRNEAKTLDGFIRLTLDRMAAQGLHDNLGGGFFRYTTDPAWQIPHYEKMLYDNAQLAVLFLDAAGLYGSEHYKATGLRTVDFMLQEMGTASGAFISSFSAVDSREREGYYYLWQDDELKSLLTADEFKAVQTAWFSQAVPESEYGHLPRWQADRQEIAAKLGWRVERLNKTLSSAQKKMLRQRGSRELLPDNKVLAAWNGLALSALSRAYTVSGDKRYAEHAERLVIFLRDRFWDGKQLSRSRDGDKALGTATLEDYALVAQGLWDWSQATAKPDKRSIALVNVLVRLAWQRYYRNGSWQQTDAALIPMLDGKLALDDSALPSATAIISRLSKVHPALLKDEAVQKQLTGHLEQVSANLSDAIFWYAGYVELLASAQR